MQWSDPVGQTGILEEILRSLKEPAGGQWPTADLLRRANIVMRKICEETECLKFVDTSNTSVAGTSQYNQPAGCSRIIKIAYAGKRIDGIFEAELDRDCRGWSAWSDTPRRYINNNTANPPNIVLVPNPSNSGDTIAIQYIIQPTEMLNATDVPFNGQNNLYSFHDLIVAGVVYRCMLEEKNQFYSEWKSIYNNGIEKLRDFVRKMPDTMITENVAGHRGGHDTFPVPRPWM